MKNIKNFNQFVNESEIEPSVNVQPVSVKKEETEDMDKVYKYGCAMLYYSFPDMEAFHSLIDKEDIYVDPEDPTFGLETEPHTTLLYGLHDWEISDDDVFNSIQSFPIPELKLCNVSTFKNEKYDVLKFDVEGETLFDINSALTQFPFTTDYPDYHPHSTIAYLKPGMADKYITKLKECEYKVNPSHIVYSKSDGTKIKKEVSNNN